MATPSDDPGAAAVARETPIFLRGWENDFGTTTSERIFALQDFLGRHAAIRRVIISQPTLLPPSARSAIEARGVRISLAHPIRNDNTTLLTTSVEAGALDEAALVRCLIDVHAALFVDSSVLIICKAGRNRSAVVAFFYYLYFSHRETCTARTMRENYERFLVSPLIDTPRTPQEIRAGRLHRDWVRQLAFVYQDPATELVSTRRLNQKWPDNEAILRRGGTQF